MAIRTLGSRYLLDEQIGQGGMGVVWRGRDKVVGAEYAIKVLRQEYANDADAVTRFVRERTVLMKFRHPAVVSVHDMIVEGDKLALVMDLVHGGDLNSYQRRCGGRLSAADAARIGAQISDGLAAAHAAGIVHRDLKPANVLLDTAQIDKGQVRLADFGVARIVGEQSATTTGTVLGTAAYLAPELLTGSQASPACDVYALGITLYEVLAGQPPFGGHVAAIMHHHLETVPARIPGVPGPLWDLISACLAKKPEERPTAEALAGSLRAPALLGALPPAVRPDPSAWQAPTHAATVLAPVALPGAGPDAPFAPGLPTVTSLQSPPPVSPFPAGAAPISPGAGQVPAGSARTGAAPASPIPWGPAPAGAVPGGAAQRNAMGSDPAGLARPAAGAVPRPMPRTTPPGHPPGHPQPQRGPRPPVGPPGWPAGSGQPQLSPGPGPGQAPWSAGPGQVPLPGQPPMGGSATQQPGTRSSRHAKLAAAQKKQRMPSPAVLAGGGSVAVLAVLLVVALVTHAGPFGSGHKTQAGGSPRPGQSTSASGHPGRSAGPSSSPGSEPHHGSGALASYGPDLVVDGDFSQTTLQPWNYVVQDAVIVPGGGLDKQNAVQLTPAPQAAVGQTVTGLTSGATYQVTGWARTNGTKIVIGAMDPANDKINDHGSTTARSWTRLSAVYTVPAGQHSAAVYCIMAWGGTGYCSDLSFRAVHRA
jgi:serine/threonine protein kinase, bacterial